MNRFMTNLKRKAAKSVKKIVLPESDSSLILKAAEQVQAEGFAKIILLGRPQFILEQSADFQIDLDGIEIIDPATYPMVDTFAQSYVDMGKEKGTEISLEEARKLISTNPLYFGSFLVKFDIADGMVAGSTYTAHDVIQAALRVIGTQPGVSTVSSSVIMITDSPQFGDDGVFILGDCSVVIDPNPTQLADIAVNCVERARRTAKILDPKVALLSYSTKGSGQGGTCCQYPGSIGSAPRPQRRF